MQSETRYLSETIDGISIFYREAGSIDAPVVLLLHGFPTSSRMYRDLIPQLAERYRVIAPDYPAFGHSAVPSRESFTYTHEHLSEMVDSLLTKLGVDRFAIYVMDFGGPIGYRLMLKYPERFMGVVIQNSPAFGETTSVPFWAPLVKYWKSGSQQDRDGARPILSRKGIKDQYVVGVPDTTLLNPDSWTFDSALIERPGVDEIMLDLLYDIRNNKKVGEEAQAFMRKNQSKVMIATGYNDALFPGETMKPPADAAGIEFNAIDSGHFALEDKSREIGALVMAFLSRVIPA